MAQKCHLPTHLLTDRESVLSYIKTSKRENQLSVRKKVPFQIHQGATCNPARRALGSSVRFPNPLATGTVGEPDYPKGREEPLCD